jgi:2-dehydro-3-deoxyphosphogluconate aldolase/(4S)-4-hydroxy-2-oxoglutarate aldolase
MLIGAGTVLSVDQVKQALDAGATYILAPGYNPTVVDFCLENQVSIYPGVCTPTEIDTALCRGLTVLKFFPAEAMGGLNYLKAISAPLAKARYLPTGGVNLQNLPDYLRFEKVLACAGTWIAKKDLIAERRFDRIRAEAEKAVQVVQEIRKPTRSS